MTGLLAAAVRSAGWAGARAPPASPWVGAMRTLAAPRCTRSLCAASIPAAPGAAEAAAAELGGERAAPADGGAGAEWASLGMAPRLLTGVIDGLGHARPTPIQSRAFLAIRAVGAPDVVIAGETGIGKTLAYLLPALDALLAEAAPAQGGATASDTPEQGGAPPLPVGAALVLQPNADLAYQAAAVAGPLLAGTGLSLLNLHEPHEYGAVAAAHVLVGTPPRVLAALYEHAERLGPRLRLAVLDEADSLLSGSFKTGARQKYPVEQLLLALRQERKARAADAASAADESPGAPPPAVRALQHVLVGATVPAHGTRNVRARVLQLFPRAAWVQSAGLHAIVPGLAVSLLRVGGAGRPARDDALAAALGGGDGGNGGGVQTLVFANTLPGVERALSVLAELGVPAAPFHKKVAVPDRRLTLARFASGEVRALVSTGLAARGLDLPAVEHVVEYEFAQNVVEHLHRVGRTARASRPGRATCLVGPEDEDLAAAIEAGLDAGTGIESAVSRNRSFRNRIKRRAAEGAGGETGAAPRGAAGGDDDDDEEGRD